MRVTRMLFLSAVLCLAITGGGWCLVARAQAAIVEYHGSSIVTVTWEGRRWRAREMRVHGGRAAVFVAGSGRARRVDWSAVRGVVEDFEGRFSRHFATRNPCPSHRNEWYLRQYFVRMKGSAPASIEVFLFGGDRPELVREISTEDLLGPPRDMEDGDCSGFVVDGELDDARTMHCRDEIVWREAP